MSMYLLSCTAPICTVALLFFWPVSWCRKLTLIPEQSSDWQSFCLVLRDCKKKPLADFTD